MKFRPIRSTLQESLKESKEFNSIDDFLGYLNSIYQPNIVVDVNFEYHGIDDRIRWNTQVVLIRLQKDDYYFISGYSDGILTR